MDQIKLGEISTTTMRYESIQLTCSSTMTCTGVNRSQMVWIHLSNQNLERRERCEKNKIASFYRIKVIEIL